MFQVLIRQFYLVFEKEKKNLWNFQKICKQIIFLSKHKFYFFLFKASLLDQYKHEDLENHATINQIMMNTDNSASTSSFSKDKLDDVLEAETRGVDFKGNVRYFCPKCNVRYIGKYHMR